MPNTCATKSETTARQTNKVRKTRATCATRVQHMPPTCAVNKNCTAHAHKMHKYTTHGQCATISQGQNICKTLTPKKYNFWAIKQNRYEGALIAQQLRSTCRQMLQRSIQSVLEVTWKGCYNVAPRASWKLPDPDLPTTRFNVVVSLTPCLYLTPSFHCLSLLPSKEQRQNLWLHQECRINNTGL